MERTEITPWFYYDVYEIGKKYHKRIVHSPSPALKKVQRIILRKYFKQNLQLQSVKTVAMIHCGHKWLLKLDILDFYNSISEEQIKEVINRYAEDKDKEDIFKICTLDGKLPTGAPTSPYIANLVMRDFDKCIEDVCKMFGVTYSRYMDDLFFSTDREQYFLSLVELEVLRQFTEMGFRINVDKIKYISSNKRQQVLGLGVNNEKPVLTKEDKREYRAYFYNLIYPLQYSKKKMYEEHERELLGHLAYIKSVDEDYYCRICRYILKLLQKWNLMKKRSVRKLIQIHCL